ncbi:hypothetical protein ABZ876_16490 [Streptomyces sp. NPDC046931]|uniref:hypothetical protein n=1 Tax=Streptomyces sp. NPDC046931 TaxID=3154806 RepID=UPI00340D8D86
MSAGLAVPTLDVVAPTVTFPPPPPPVDPQTLPHTGMLDLHHAASSHLADAAGHTLHQAADAALQALGSLSGVLLAGRAALLTTRVLAAAAVRAAEEQRCLERQQELSATAARQWEAAAFAAVRANARRTALLARAARAARGPGGGPPLPDLPPPLEPIGTQLDVLRQQLSALEAAVQQAEEAYAAWEIKRLGSCLESAVEDDDWQRTVRDHRQRMLRRFTRSRTAEAERSEEETPDPLAGTEQTVEEVRKAGADILSALDPSAASRTAELAAAAVGHAVRQAAANPRRARIHLKEARKFVRDANSTARSAREAEERAAAQLDFLSYEPPEGAERLERAPEEEGLLRRFLEEGVPLSPAGRASVEQRVKERLGALEALYVREQCTRVMAELAEKFGGPAGAGRPAGQELRLDWTPEGWEPDHWLRATLDGGTFRVATMYRGTPGERTPPERALDDARCKEAQEQLARFREIARESGLTVDFVIERTEGAVPGLPGDDAVRLDEVISEMRDASDERRDGPSHRTVDDDGRR